jgi:GNAT superfamily N-acetyltransferase
VKIRLATPADAEYLPEVEQSAGLSYLAIADIAWVAHDGNMPAEIHRVHAASGTEWVAETDDGKLVAFLCAERCGDELHIWEFAVAQEWQRAGIGRRMIDAVFAYAKASGSKAVTLTTFSDVPWNAPWYARVGFELLDEGKIGERLAAIVRQETERGLPRRCAMRRRVGGS